MEPVARQHVRGDPVVQGRERRGAGADLVGQRREAEGDALARLALGLPVQRLGRPNLLATIHFEKFGQHQPLNRPPHAEALGAARRATVSAPTRKLRETRRVQG